MMQYKKIVSTLTTLVLLIVMTTNISAHSVPIDKSLNLTNEHNFSVSKSSQTYSGLGEARQEDLNNWSTIEKKSPSKVQKSKMEISATDSSSWYFTSNNFYYYAQEKQNTCGPASARMVLTCLKQDFSYTESQIALGCKSGSVTYLTDIAKYVNSQQMFNLYLVRFQQTKATMESDLYDGIVTYNAPPIVGISETTSTGWPFDIPGHAITIYAVQSNKSEFAIADPWAGYIGSSSYKWYDKSSSALYYAYNSINAGYMY